MRQCSGTVPYRIKGRVEVLLVKSNSGDGWVFPKGGMEPALSAKANAVKETWEEAGAIGVVRDWLATFEFRGQNVRYFSLSVVSMADAYPEVETRERRWVEINDAREWLPEPLHQLLDELLEKLA